MRRAMVFLLAAMVAATLGAGTLSAQTQFGTISGRVTDSTGAIVPLAKVTITNAATNVASSSETNNEGIYVLANVLAGEYDLVVEKAGFKKVTARITLAVAQRLQNDIRLEVGQVSEVVTVTESALAINTVTGELSRAIVSQELQTLPLLTRNPYALVALAPGVSDTAATNGDVRGVGMAVGGSRTSSINFLLDGTENNETFGVGPSTLVPVDAIQEFRVQSNNMTSEFGRNSLVTNVITKSGTNDLHGSAYEYYRGAALSSNTAEDKANGNPKSNFVRNVFGASAGGRIIKDKTFFFGAFEGMRVRSSGNNIFFVPTQQFVSNASTNMGAYVTGFGGLPKSDPASCLTASDIAGIFSGAITQAGQSNPGYGSTAANSLNTAGTTTLIPASTPLFCRAATHVPIDAGGGLGQNTWSYVGKVDHRFTQNTSLSARYAFFDQKFPNGAGVDSPYAQFQTPASFRSQNANLTLTHAFSARLFSESRLSFSRTDPEAPLGQAPVTAPCIQYSLRTRGTPGANPIVFPGYLPSACGGFSIPSGGPQNTISAFAGFTFLRGRQTFKWGGSMSHLRDNHIFGAFANANGTIANPQNLLNGQVDTSFSVAIDPKGKFPGNAYNQSVDGPFTAPRFGRHFRYNEVAFYGEDAVKITPRLTVTLGLRWEYFGVLHSPEKEKFLDANLFLDAVGATKAQNPSKSIYEQVRDARFSRTSNLFNQNWGNFGPRVGVAYDIFGNGHTVFRGGYGIFYDKNFGNALFNVIQNFPNYAVLTLQTPFPVGPSGPVDINQYTTLGNLAGAGNFNLAGSARMLNRDMKSAYSEQWNATIEHDILGKGVIASLSYVGTNGIHLYSLNNLNQRGSCLLLLAAVPTASCNPVGGNSSRINQTGLTGMNRRGNEGLSRYNALNVEVRTREIAHTGATVSGAYTWAHSIDNSSSFFNDSAFDGTGNFGFRDAYNPALDRASSSNDIRHRLSMSWNWEIPFAKGLHGVAGQALHGWSLSGVYVAQTGGTFTVYDDFSFSSQCNISFTNACYPVLTGSSLPKMDGKTPNGPNSYVLYDVSSLLQSQSDYCSTHTLNSPAGPLTELGCTAVLANLRPDLLSGRNLFRLPGFWNWDMAVSKSFNMPWEKHKLRFRAEFFNLPNHSNLYGDANTNSVSDTGLATNPAGSQIIGAKRGVRPGSVFGVARDRRNIQLALRYEF